MTIEDKRVAAYLRLKSRHLIMETKLVQIRWEKPYELQLTSLKKQDASYMAS